MYKQKKINKKKISKRYAFIKNQKILTYLFNIRKLIVYY